MTWLVLGAILSCKGDPARSYCEAVCDWGVTCQSADHTVADADALTQQCLSDTHAVDGGCEKAEAGSLDPASRKLLDTCTAAVDAASSSGQCEGFTGNIEEIDTSVPPTECATQGTDDVATYDAAVHSTAETGEELCQRFTETFCHRADDCIVGDFAGNVPQSAIDALGGTPYELCVQRLEADLTSPCKTNDLYATEESRTSEPNLARQSARECLRDFTTITCEDLFAGNLSETCAGSFTSTDQAVAVATALYDLSQDFAQYAP